MVKHERGNWVFSSGRSRRAYTEQLSIEFDEGRPQISLGFDQRFWDADEVGNLWVEEEEALSKEDLKELAELQIQRWQQFIEWLSHQEKEESQS
jgi:hypothetical protein